MDGCRRARLLRFESRLAHVELDARRSGVVCSTSELGAENARRSWLADLLTDAVSPPLQCDARRLRALGRFVSAAAGCVAERVEMANAVGALPDCMTGALQRFEELWTRDPDAGCAVSLGDAIARVMDGLLVDAADHVSVCANGRREGIEECDDGNLHDQDGCDAACRLESCGAGIAPCRRCGHDAALSDAGECVCAAGYADDDGDCADVDECATGTAECPAGTSCVNVPGTYACAVPCTEQGLVGGIAACGGPTRLMTFACRDQRIRIANDGGWGNRRVRCDGLVLDGLDRNVTFQMDPPCFEAAGSTCPDIDDGTGFLVLEGNDITVRNISVRWFFDGIQSRGRDNTVENVTFTRQCDDAVTNAATGVGTLFRDLVLADGCDKCAQSFGDATLTSSDPASRDHYNAVFDGVDFVGCAQPLRMTYGGRFLVTNARMFARRRSAFACRGPFFTSPTPDSLSVTLRDSIVSGCRRGIRFGGSAQGLLEGNLVEKSAVAGVRVSRSARASLAGNRIVMNGGRSGAEGGSGGVVVTDQAAVDLGGGSLDFDGAALTSPGENLLCGNEGTASVPLNVDASLLAGAGPELSACNNWWCDDDPAQATAGGVTFAPYAGFPR